MLTLHSSVLTPLSTIMVCILHCIVGKKTSCNPCQVSVVEPPGERAYIKEQARRTKGRSSSKKGGYSV